jgi:hypothetical protein
MSPQSENMDAPRDDPERLAVCSGAWLGKWLIWKFVFSGARRDGAFCLRCGDSHKLRPRAEAASDASAIPYPLLVLC